jgi:hypothetical protein
MSLLTFIVDKMGVYGAAMIVITALYAGMLASAAWDLLSMAFTSKERLAERSRERKLVRFFTGCNDIVKVATVAGFFLTLIGFQQVIEGFRVVDKGLALTGMTTAVLSSACYVPLVALAALWLLLTRVVIASRPDIAAFVWGSGEEEKPA